MYQINSKSSLKAALLLGAATATAMSLSSPAMAQPVETVIVTGSLIPTPNATSNSPIQTVGAEQIDLSGHADVQQVLNQLPQIVPGLGASSNNPGGGESIVDLRGLSPNRNLLLVDGRRAMPTALTGEVDVNTIPAALIDHVDVVTGGGSATYGSDAISGVVNFVLKKDFEGLQATARYGQEVENGFSPEKELNVTMGVNSGDGKANVTIFGEFYKRDVTFQGQDKKFLLDNGGGSATGPSGRADGSQGFPKIARNNPSGGGVCSGKSSTYAFFTNGDPHGFCNSIVPTGNAFADAEANKTNALGTIFGTVLDPGGDRFNFAPFNDLVTPLTRHTLAGMGHYDIYPGIEAFASFHYTNVQDENELAPTPVTNLPAPLGFFAQPKGGPCVGVGTTPGNGVFGCDPALTTPGAYVAFLTNPGAPGGIGTTAFISPTFQKDIDARSATIDPATKLPRGYSPFAVRIRTVQLGPRIADFNTSLYQMTGGLRGPTPFLDGWDWEAYYDFGRADFGQIQQHNVLQSHLNQAMLGCPPGSAVGCEPIDIFGAFNLNKWQTVHGGLDFTGTARTNNPTQPQVCSAASTTGCSGQNAARFIDYTTHSMNDYERQVFHAGTHGNIGDYWGAGPISMAFGVEWRKDQGTFDPDAASRAFDIQGFTPALKTSGNYNVWELFGEARVPVLTDMPFAKELTLDAGYRFSRYSNSGDASTWKAGGEWQVFDDVRFRTMWQRALRAPNINDLFNGGVQAFPAFIADPCKGTPGSAATIAFCTDQFAHGTGAGFGGANTSVYSTPYAQVNTQSEAVFYGNPNLKPETSNTFTVGAVLTPSFLPNVTASVDFWRIGINHFIGVTAVTKIEAACRADWDARGGATVFANPFATLGQTTSGSPCDFVARQADGEMVFNIPEINQVGTLKTSGIDLQLSASHDVADLLDQSGDWGALDANFALELLTEFVSNTGATLKGYIDAVSPAVFAQNDIRPNYKFNFHLGYTLGDWRAVVTWSETGGVKDCFTSIGSVGTSTVRNCIPHGGSSTTQAGTDLRKYDRVDLAIRWNFAEKYSADLIINNIFNVNPPLGPYSAAGGINTLNDSYDVLHTQAFIGLTAKL